MYNTNLNIACHLTEYPEYWAVLAESFGIEHILDIGNNSLPLDKEIVLFSPQKSSTVRGSISLQDFEHPITEILYCFGSDFGELSTWKHDSKIVYIPTNYSDILYANHAAAIVLYDRMIKLRK